MVKKEKAEQVAENVAEQQEAVAGAEKLAPEAQAQVFTPEQQTQIEALIAEAEKKGYGESKEEIERKEKVIKRLQGERSQKVTTREPITPSDDSVLLQTIIADMKAKEVEDGEVNPRRVILEQELVNRTQKASMAQFEAYKQDTIEKEWAAIEQKASEAGQDLEDGQFDTVRDAFEIATGTGKFEEAHRRFDRILKKVKPEGKETKKVELTDEEREEIARSYLEKAGKLKSDTGGPSGGEKTYKGEEVLETLDPSSMTPQQIHEQVLELLKAEKEGRIK